MKLEEKFKIITHGESNNNSICTHLIYLIVKGAFDKITSLLAIILLSPVLVLISIAIKINDPSGPIIYSQERIGKDKIPFKIFKFRSMSANAEQILKSDERLYAKYITNNFKLFPEDDPRITKVGKFLRKTSLDELPQFFNIMIGNMSLVGPRPVIYNELKEYDEDKLLSVKPGAMGLWQAKGRSNIGYPQRARIEEYYVDHAGIVFDLKIFFRNILNIFSRKGAY